ASVRPELATARVQRLADVIEPQLRPWRIAATLFSAFGTVAVLIAAIGLYGVISHTTAQRTVEIAVRRALGARAHHIAWTVVAEGWGVPSSGMGWVVSLRRAMGPWAGRWLFRRDLAVRSSAPGVAGRWRAVGVGGPGFRRCERCEAHR